MGLVLIFIFTSVFIYNKKDKALENCADFNWLDKSEILSLTIKILSKKVQKEIYNSKDLSASRRYIKAAKLNEVNAKKEWKTFAKDNFLITEKDLIRFENIALKLSLGFKKLEITDKIPKLKLNKTVTTFEEKQEFDRLFDIMVEKIKARRYFEKFFIDQFKNVFVGLKFKKKFKEESYQKYFKKCEILHKKLSSTFIEKWGE